MKTISIKTRFSRHSILIFIIICLFQRSLGQITYENSYAANSYLDQVIKMPDGGNTLTSAPSDGCHVGQICKTHLTLSRFDSIGKLVWNKNIYGNYSFANSKGVALPDNSIIIFSALYDGNAGINHGGVLIKLSSKGNIVWTKQLISKTYKRFAPQILTLDDDGSIILLYTVSNRVDSYYLQMDKLNNSGDIIWNKTFNFKAYIYDFYSATAFLQYKNKYIIGGDINCQVCEGTATANILVTDTSGNVLECKDLPANPNNGYQYSTSIYSLFAKNDVLHIVGYYRNDNENTYYNYIAPLKPNSSEVNITRYKPDDLVLQYLLRSHKSAFPLTMSNFSYFKKNGSYVTVANPLKNNSIAQYDSLGRICPLYTLPEIDTSTSVAQLYVIPRSIFMIKDSVGFQKINIEDSSAFLQSSIICSDAHNINQSVSTSKKNVVFNLSPNPATNVLRIQGLSSNKTKLTVVDFMGNVKLQIAANTSSYNLNITALLPGNYLLKIEMNDAVVTKKFVKE